MKTETIPTTLPSKENTCLKCGLEMTLSLNEHVELRRCPCGYWTRTVNGDTKRNFNDAIGSCRITRSHRHDR